MNKKTLLLISILMLSGIFILSACTGSAALTRAGNWPGVTVDSETVYVAYNDHITAVKDGIMAWQYPSDTDGSEDAQGAETTYYTTPLVENGKVYAATYNNQVAILDAETGKQQDFIQLPNSKQRVISTPCFDEGMLYVISADGSVYAYDSEDTSSPKWSQKFSAEVWTKPVVVDGRIFVAAMDKNIYELAAEDGKIVSSWHTDGAIMSDMTEKDGILYFSTLAKQVCSFDPSSGEISTIFTSEGEVWGTPLVVDEYIAIGDMSGNAYFVNLTDSSIEWEYNNDDETNRGFIPGPVLLGEDKIFFAAENGHLFVFDLEGSLVMDRETGLRLLTPPVINGDSVVIAEIPAEQNDLLRAYDFDLKEEWIYSPSSDTESN